MKRPYLAALISGGLGVGAIIWALVGGEATPSIALFIAAGSAPAAVLAAVWGRLGGRFPLVAVVLGALLAPLLALLSHPLVAGFTAAFVNGFAGSGRQLIDALRIDPRLTTVLASPWVLVLIVELTAVAPFTEEFAKAFTAIISRPRTRREAFLFGVAAGAGFAISENILYAVLGAAFGSLWPVIAVARSMGSAVHPLACGLVMLGWWEWRQHRRVRSLLRGYLSGVGIHALWNGSLVVIAIVESVLTLGGSAASPLKPIALTYCAMLGVILAGVLGVVASNVADERETLTGLNFRSGRAVTAWIVLSASLLVPVAVLVLAFPAFYRG